MSLQCEWSPMTDCPAGYSEARDALVSEMHVNHAELHAACLEEMFNEVIKSASWEELAQRSIALRETRANFNFSRKLFAARGSGDNQNTSSEEGLTPSQHLKNLYAVIVDSEKLLVQWQKSVTAPVTDWLYYQVVVSLPPIFDPMRDIILFYGAGDASNVLASLGFQRAINLEHLMRDVPKFLNSADDTDLESWLKAWQDLEALTPEFITTICMPDHQRADLDSAKVALASAIERINVNKNTLNRFGNEWVSNAKKNYELRAEFENWSTLRGYFKNQKVLIVGPAPSLRDDLGALQALSSKYTVICLSQALPAVMEAGVTPDIIIITDSQYLPSHFPDVHVSRKVFAFDLCVDPRHVSRMSHMRLWPYIASEAKAVAFAGFPDIGVMPWLLSGGSVSHCAIALAFALGFDDIVLMGHDFCLTGDYRYATQSFELDKLDSAPESRKVSRVSTNSGEMAFAPLDLDLFRKYIEEMLQHSAFKTGQRVKTTSSRAASIKGVEFVPASELIQEMERIRFSKREIPECENFLEFQTANISRSVWGGSGDGQAFAEKIWRDYKLAGVFHLDGEISKKLFNLCSEISTMHSHVSLEFQRRLNEISTVLQRDVSPALQRFLCNELLAVVWSISKK